MQESKYMLKSKNHRSNGTGRKNGQYKKLASMGEKTKVLIDELYSPIDAINRFINLALHGVGEGSQSRQFLLESKEGIRKTTILLERLNENAVKIEKEIRDIFEKESGSSRSNHK